MNLICPRCQSALNEESDGFRCKGCQTLYSRNQGIVSFLDPEELFNESPFASEQLAHWTQTARLREKIKQSRLLSALNQLRINFSLSGRRDRIFLSELKRSAAPNPLILDIGCGGGRHYFARYGRVIGIDPAIELLGISKHIYAAVFQSGGLNLPFAEGTFDYVVSSDVIGHIENQDKDQLFSEIHRVMKNGGRTVHCAEVHGTSPWWTFAMKYPDLFQKYFIEKPGHIGLERPTELRARFKKHGFREIRFLKLSSIIQQPGAAAALFDNEFKEKSRPISLMVGLDKILSSSLFVEEVLNFILEPIAHLDDLLTPLDYASGVLTVHEK